MPRSGAGKKNQHNHRHENGLVGPGKRITKQRSNGQLSGAAKGPVPDTPPLTPTASADPLMRTQIASDSNASLSDSKQDMTGNTGCNQLRKRNSESSADGQNTCLDGSMHEKDAAEGGSRRYDAAVAKSTSCNEIGTLQLASTILKSCPAYDTIAMLILLLQLPPIFLTLVQALFASLTFMPPSGVTMTSLFSLFDVFQGSAGTPSLGTMIAVDALCLGGWFCLWNWARNFALDLAQVQIAITLGGGNAGKAGSVNSVCVTVVLLLHLLRSRSVRQFIFHHVLSGKFIANEYVTYIAHYIPQDLELGDTPKSPSWSRSLFAIHIITQAGIAIIRRNVASSQAGSTSKISKRADTEASAGAQSNQEMSSFEFGFMTGFGGTTDGQTPPMPGSKDSKDRAISAKKRRRLANQVRSRQPFWAALASTKVNALREIEISRPSSKAISNSAVENSDTHPGEEIQVRITHVDCSSIKFEAINLTREHYDEGSELSPHRKPFFIRINGAYWTSTCASTPATDLSGTLWTGEISGLAPNCTYTCSFVQEDDLEVATVMVKTPAVLDKDQTSALSSISSPLFRRSQRPSSPTTTIRQSIATTEAKLTDTKGRVSRTRRSHKAALSKLEKEVDFFSSRLKSNSDDTKQRQKLLQAERSMKQNEDAAQSISAALDDLSTIPEEECDDHSSKKEAYDKQCTLLAAANESLISAKSSADSELTTFNEDLKAINRQRERLLARQTRLNEQHDRITQANLQGLNEKERKAAETLATARDHSRMEAEYSNQFSIFQRELASFSIRIQQAKQESQVLESHMMHLQQNNMIGGGPLTPEGILPGTNPIARPAQTALSHGFPSNHAMTTLPAPLSPESTHVSPFLPYSKPLGFQNDHIANFGPNRARSASNRSGGAVSNYSADFEDADPIPPMHGVTKFSADGKRKGSGGSGKASPTSGGNTGAIGIGGVGSPLRPNAMANLPGRGIPGQGPGR